MKNALIFFPILLLMLASCEPKPERVVESEWSTEQPKLVSFFIEVDDVKFKQGEEKYYENGKLEYTGTYDPAGERHGDWKYYYSNGNLWSTGSYEHGIKTGVKQVYWPEGKLRYEGNFTDDQKSGHWIFYDMEGNIIEEKDY